MFLRVLKLYEVSYIIKMTITLRSSNSIPIYLHKRLKTHSEKYVHRFMTGLFTIAKIGPGLGVHQPENSHVDSYIFTQWNAIQQYWYNTSKSLKTLCVCVHSVLRYRGEEYLPLWGMNNDWLDKMKNFLDREWEWCSIPQQRFVLHSPNAM